MEEVDKDNSELLDAGAATQQLSTDDIAAMRAAGKTGEEIAAALAEGSATFLSKTQFSQAKYKKKKQKKYSTFATLQRPAARSICEVCKHHVTPGMLNKFLIALLSSPRLTHSTLQDLALPGSKTWRSAWLVLPCVIHVDYNKLLLHQLTMYAAAYDNFH